MPLSDLVIADLMEAEEVGNADAPTQKFSGIDAKDVDQIKLAQLALILEGSPLDTTETMNRLSSFTLLYERTEEGPWVYGVPDPLVAALASLEGTHRASVAREWAGIEEFQLDGWEPAEVASFLDSVCGLAKEARAIGKGILLWMYL